MPARRFGNRASGGRIEVMVERVLDPRRFLAQLAFSRAPKVDEVLQVEGVPVRVVGVVKKDAGAVGDASLLRREDSAL